MASRDPLELVAQEGQWLLVLVGLPASGKSTFRGQVQSRLDHIRVVCPDEIRPVIYGATFDPRHESIVWQVTYSVLNYWLRLGEPVIFDATNLSQGVRKPLIDTARRHGSRVWSIYFRVSLEVALSRNARRDRVVPPERVRDMADRLEPPSLEEGFDQVLTVEPEERP